MIDLKTLLGEELSEKVKAALAAKARVARIWCWALRTTGA